MFLKPPPLSDLTSTSPRDGRLATIFTGYCAMSLRGRGGRKKKISFRAAREKETEKKERESISHSVRKHGNRIAGRLFVDVHSRESNDR